MQVNASGVLLYFVSPTFNLNLVRCIDAEAPGSHEHCDLFFTVQQCILQQELPGPQNTSYQSTLQLARTLQPDAPNFPR